MTRSPRNASIRPSLRSRSALASLMTTVAVGASVLNPAMASADSPPVAAYEATTHQVASAPYSALFNMGVPVYERVAFIREPGSHSRTMIMKRLRRASEGKRGSARYVFLGDRLPNSFLVGEDWSRNGTPQGLVVPLTRKSKRHRPTQYQAVTTLTGPVGEVRAIAWSHRYLG
ncbi:hypothetical protein [Gordonia sp. (in: high G+C Gram-positive bacteria)]|uniref:hypothetical protein n=1 Tax=Gordonia sp. (in: high G+C Gram-positive bacteria) TaxID=84139 RepID=UPI003C71DE4B